MNRLEQSYGPSDYLARRAAANTKPVSLLERVGRLFRHDSGDRRIDPPSSDAGRTVGVEPVKPGNVIEFPKKAS